MTHTLSAKEQALSKIFSDDYVFTIPTYQRPYSWGTDHAQELLDDLLGYMRAGSSELDEMAPYFLGSIVLIKRESVADSQVVDGQQRLTTLTLLLSAIRATVVDKSVQDGITKCIYEHGNVVFATKARYRLSLRDRERDFFRQYVQHEGGIEQLHALNDKLPDAQHRLRENARLFLTALTGLSEEVRIALVRFIVNRCYLVTVATPDLDSAYRIFGVLNSRGLDLSATDILKAEIIGALAGTQRDAYTHKWEDLEEDLGRDAFGELFSHIRMVYRKAKPQGTLLKEFREHVGPTEPTAFIDNVLMPMAQAYREITDSDYSSQKLAEPINETLRWLNRIKFKDWMPPALAFVARHRNDPERMLLFFRDLERLAYSMLVRKVGVNHRIERFSALTLAVESDKDLHASTPPLQLSPKEQFDTYTALSGPLYDTHSARALSVILLRLDRLLSDGSAKFDHDVATVEHVLPQQPRGGSQWLEWVPAAQHRERWVHRLANLALLSRKKNSSASNFEFDRKKTAYFTKGGVCLFALTTQILQHPQWTLDVLEARQNRLLGVLEQHWRLQDRELPVVQQMASGASASGDSPIFEIESARHGLRATARESGGQFIVIAGSTAKPAWTGPAHSYEALRDELVASGALSTVDEAMVFSRDVRFNSPSAASAVILGRPDNGRLSWVVAGTGMTYAEWRDGPLDGSGEDATPATSGERQQIFRRFWAGFIERSRPVTSLFANRSTTGDHWLSAGIGRTGFFLTVTLTQDIGRTEIYVRLPNDDGARTDAAFNALFARRQEIEAQFGAELDWQPLPHRAGSRICIEIPGGWKQPESQWPQLQDQLIELSNRLAEAFREPIQGIKT